MAEVKKGGLFHSSIQVLKYTYVLPHKKDRVIMCRIIYTTTRLAAFIVFFVIPCIHLISTIRTNKGVDMSEDLSTMFGGFGAIIMSTLFLNLYEKWLTLFTDLENLKNIKEPSNFEELKKKLNLYSVFYAIYTLTAIVVYGTAAALDTSYCKHMNEEKGLNEMCGMFTPMMLPFDGNHNYIRIPIFVFQAFLAKIIFPPLVSVSFISYEAVQVLRCHLSELKQCFLDTFEAPSNEEKRLRLGFCVYYHEKILSLCHRLTVLVKFTSGNMAIICALIFATILNMLLKSKPMAGIAFFMGYVVALFLLCHGGQLIEDETLSVGDALYNSKWYEADVKIQKDVVFILTRCQKPGTLEVIPLGTINYHLFLLIMKTSYTYLTLLNQKT